MDFKGDTEHAPDFESICPSLDNSTLSLITKKSTANLTKTANTSMQKSSHPSQIPASRKPPIAAAYNILNTEISIPPQKLNPSSLPQQPLVQHQLQQNIVGSYFTPAAYTPQKLVSSPFIGNVSKTRPIEYELCELLEPELATDADTDAGDQHDHGGSFLSQVPTGQQRLNGRPHIPFGQTAN
jgi:hypothetical protein